MDRIPEVSERRPDARELLLHAFRDIVLESGYDGVTVLDVVRRAGVARSTFYEHFQNREDLLRDSIRGPLQVLAAAAGPKYDGAQTAFMLTHFSQNRNLAASLLDGSSASIVRDLLAELIARAARVSEPASHAAAGAQLALVLFWLSGRDRRPADAAVETMRSITLAAIAGK